MAKSKVPAESVLNTGQQYDYIDSYEEIIADRNNKIAAKDVARVFFTSSNPKWIGILFSLRNKIVSVFGLKSGSESERQKLIENVRRGTLECVAGEQYGFFKAYDVRENEVILGEDDKHLDFRVSLLLLPFNDNSKKVIITTTVAFKNWFGRLYFFFIRPFHKQIVSTMLKRMVEDLEKEAEK